MTSQETSDRLVQAVKAVIATLELPRDRLGRLDPPAIPSGSHVCDQLRELAVYHGVCGSKDYMEQCAKVLKSALFDFTRKVPR